MERSWSRRWVVMGNEGYKSMVYDQPPSTFVVDPEHRCQMSLTINSYFR